MKRHKPELQCGTRAVVLDLYFSCCDILFWVSAAHLYDLRYVVSWILKFDCSYVDPEILFWFVLAILVDLLSFDWSVIPWEVPLLVRLVLTGYIGLVMQFLDPLYWNFTWELWFFLSCWKFLLYISLLVTLLCLWLIVRLRFMLAGIIW